MQTVFYVMSGVLATTFLVAVRGLPRGRAAVPLSSLGEAPAGAGPPQGGL